MKVRSCQSFLVTKRMQQSNRGKPASRNWMAGARGDDTEGLLLDSPNVRFWGGECDQA